MLYSEFNVLIMKSGITLALLLGALIGVAGAVFGTMHLPGANALLIVGLFVLAIAVVFKMLQDAPSQHE
jgi:hypothetical protein